MVGRVDGLHCIWLPRRVFRLERSGGNTKHSMDAGGASCVNASNSNLLLLVQAIAKIFSLVLNALCVLLKYADRVEG